MRASTSRSGGPGGQNVNKVETRVTIEVAVDALPLTDDQKESVRERLAGRINQEGNLRVTSQSERSQLTNRKRAIDRIEQLLRDAITPQPPRRKTRTPKAEKQKRIDEKRRRSRVKQLRSRPED